MFFERSQQGIGRGEVAESRIEAPFFAAFTVACALAILLVHLTFGNGGLTVALAAGLTAFGITVVRVDLGVSILVVSMLLSPELDLGNEVSGERSLNVRYDDLLIVVIFLGVLVKLAFEGRFQFWRPSPINAGILIYFSVALFSTMLALRANLPAWDPRDALFVMLKMAEFYMIFFMVSAAMRGMRDLQRQLALFLAVAVIVCGYCILSIGKVERIGAPFEAGGTEPNTLGGYLTVVMCLTVALLTQAPTYPKKILFVLLTLLAFLPFLFTLSRASYVALLVAMLVLGTVARKWYVLTTVVLVLALSPVFMPEGVKDRVNYTFQRGAGAPIVIGGRKLPLQVDKSTHERFYVWEKAWYNLQVWPWFGGGVGWESVLDSQYARVIMETGILGMAAFLFMQYRVLKTCRESYLWSHHWVSRAVGMGTTAATIGLIVHSLGTISFLIVRIMEPFWFLVALAVVSRAMAAEEWTRRARQQRATVGAPSGKPSRADVAADPSSHAALDVSA